ncbi:hypothetical protein MRX96_051055, partial [Rhipicephalus microplus]
ADVLTSSQSSNGWAVLIVTPIMRRAQHLESAQSITFVDSTSSCDLDGSTDTVLLTSTKAGAVPIAVLVHSSQSREGSFMQKTRMSWKQQLHTCSLYLIHPMSKEFRHF